MSITFEHEDDTDPDVTREILYVTTSGWAVRRTDWRDGTSSILIEDQQLPLDEARDLRDALTAALGEQP